MDVHPLLPHPQSGASYACGFLHLSVAQAAAVKVQDHCDGVHRHRSYSLDPHGSVLHRLIIDRCWPRCSPITCQPSSSTDGVSPPQTLDLKAPHTGVCSPRSVLRYEAFAASNLSSQCAQTRRPMVKRTKSAEQLRVAVSQVARKERTTTVVAPGKRGTTEQPRLSSSDAARRLTQARST